MTSVAFNLSYVALWILVSLLTTVVAALARQIGLLHRRISPAGARLSNPGPAIGEKVAPFSGEGLYGSRVVFPTPGRNLLLTFLSPGCSICEETIPALKAISRQEKRRLDVILVSMGGDADTNREYGRKHGLDHLPFVLSPELSQRLGVLTAPYTLMVDENGVLRSKGLVNGREHFESLLNVIETGFESAEAFRRANRGALNATSN